MISSASPRSKVNRTHASTCLSCSCRSRIESLQTFRSSIDSLASPIQSSDRPVWIPRPISGGCWKWFESSSRRVPRESRSSCSSRTCTGSTRPADELLRSIVQAHCGDRGFAVLNFRPEYAPRLENEPYYCELRLDPLSERALQSLVLEKVGDHHSLGNLPSLIFERSRGNPFFAEEILQELIETKILVGLPGHYEAAETITRIDVPDAVQDTLNARIDRLRAEEKELLHTASVIGKTFSDSVLFLVADLDGQSVADAMRNLVEAEFLVLQAVYSGARVRLQAPPHPGGRLRLAALRIEARDSRTGCRGSGAGACGRVR